MTDRAATVPALRTGSCVPEGPVNSDVGGTTATSNKPMASAPSASPARPTNDSRTTHAPAARSPAANSDQPTTVQPLTQQVIDALRRARAWGSPAPGVDDLCRHNASFRAMVRNTISATSLSGGVKHNVIPAFAEATLDCRLLPGESHESFLRRLREVIDDPSVEIETVMQSESGFSDFHSTLVDVITAVVREQVEEALVLPVTCVGFTDSRVLRRRGVQAYGFIPVLMDSSLAATVHGHNERIPIEGLRSGAQILFEVVRRFCA